MHPRCDTGPPVPAVRTAPVGWVWGGFAPWPPIPKGWPDFCTLLARRRNWARGKFPLGLVGGVQEGAAPCPPAGSAVRVRGAAERGPAPRGQLGWVAKRCGHREGLSTASGVSATAHALSSSFPGESVSLLSFTFFLFLSFPLPLFSFPLCLLFIPSSPFYPFHPFPSCRSTACLQPFFWHCPAGRSANLVAERPHERSQLCWTEAAPRNKNSATFFSLFFFSLSRALLPSLAAGRSSPDAAWQAVPPFLLPNAGSRLGAAMGTPALARLCSSRGADPALLVLSVPQCCAPQVPPFAWPEWDLRGRLRARG